MKLYITLAPEYEKYSFVILLPLTRYKMMLQYINISLFYPSFLFLMVTIEIIP